MNAPTEIDDTSHPVEDGDFVTLLNGSSVSLNDYGAATGSDTQPCIKKENTEVDKIRVLKTISIYLAEVGLVRKKKHNLYCNLFET